MGLRTGAMTAALSLIGLLASIEARAQLVPSYTEYASGTTGPGTVNGLSSPGTYSYSDTTLLPDTTTGLLNQSAYPTQPQPSASFYDAFLITVPTSQVDTISSTITLPSGFAISDFQERLYAYTGTAPIIGPVAGATQAWTSPVGTLGTVAVLGPDTVTGGTYVLEVRGDVTGASGGSYSGTINLEPVPLPAALPLLLSGLGLLGGALRRARSA